MIVDFRLYRVAFAPALLAFVTLMFSLQGVPPPLEPAVPPAAFEASRAAATARELVSTAPERPPGSAGDAAAADLIAERFTEIRAGTVSEQAVSGSFDGEPVNLRNVLILLPGDSNETIVVIANRDSPRGPGAASSAAASGILVELAAALGASSHAKTFVLASVSGGGTGARAVLDAVPYPEAVEAAVTVSQPGTAHPHPPFVVTSSTGPARPAAQLRVTAAQAVEAQTGEVEPGVGFLGQLARLAFPAGVGAQAALIDAGVDAVAISAAGERPLDSAEDGIEDLSTPVLGDFGRAVASTVQAIDAAAGPLEPGPEPYVEVAGNLVPGWAISLLALSLLLPAGVAAADALLRASRRSRRPTEGIAWAGTFALPLLAGLGALYLLALLGLVPRPPVPFDPGQHGFGAAALASSLLIAAAAVAAVLWIRGLAPSASDRASAIGACGGLAVAATLVVWLANPYLGLLLVPLGHAWLVPAAGAPSGPTAFAAVLSLGPVVIALAEVAGALELGARAPWTFLIMVATGQIGFLVAAATCVLAGALIAATAAARRERRAPGPHLGAGT